MGKIYADTSNQQVVDFKDLILQINFFIIQNAGFGNTNAVSELVDQLGNIMDPYVDKRYEKDLEKLDDIEIATGCTSNEVKQIRSIAAKNRVEKKHRALMRLAYRRRFLPSSSTGAKGGYDGGEQFDK